MAKEVVGFIGLGNMGKPMANNIARAGYEMVVFDIAGTAERASEGATIAASVRDVAEQSTTVFLSLPTLVAHTEVATEIAESNVREGLVVVNTSTVGARVAAEAHQRLSEKGVGYADARCPEARPAHGRAPSPSSFPATQRCSRGYSRYSTLSAPTVSTLVANPVKGSG